MKLVSIAGARPQFVKLAVLCRAIDAARPRGSVRHRILHTGQHYDAGMNGVFFSQLGIPEPDVNLQVGSGAQAAQTALMMQRLEPALAADPPDWVILYGDTNSTLAGAMVAAKMGLPCAHVEAGLRSFNRRMPEEINRVVADRLSRLLFCPTRAAVENLAREGMREGVILCGDVMYDAALFHLEQALRQPEAARYAAGQHALATIHRAENTDDPRRLAAILSALERISGEICPVILPLHPRTRNVVESLGWRPRRVRVLEPLSYLEMLAAESRARFIVTDSGGVQKEAYFFRVPCVTARDETEWVETLDNGCNALAGASAEAIVDAARRTALAGPWEAVYGDGNAGGHILEALISHGGELGGGA